MRGRERRVTELGHDVELLWMQFLELHAHSAREQGERRRDLLFARDSKGELPHQTTDELRVPA